MSFFPFRYSWGNREVCEGGYRLWPFPHTVLVSLDGELAVCIVHRDKASHPGWGTDCVQFPWNRRQWKQFGFRPSNGLLVCATYTVLEFADVSRQSKLSSAMMEVSIAEGSRQTAKFFQLGCSPRSMDGCSSVDCRKSLACKCSKLVWRSQLVWQSARACWCSGPVIPGSTGHKYWKLQSTAVLRGPSMLTAKLVAYEARN